MMAKILLQSIDEIKKLEYLKLPQKVDGIMDDGDAEKDLIAA